MLRLTYLEVEGFKSFRDRTVIGPLAGFTCIIGPNGCGKSVVGEAIAFALGGNRKMLRAGSLAGLINQERKAAGHCTAQVTLRLDILAAPESNGTCATTTIDANIVAATEQNPFNTNKDQQQPPGDTLVGTLQQGKITDTLTAEHIHELAATTAAAVEIHPEASKIAGLQHELTAQANDQSCKQQEAQPRWLGIRRVLKGSSTHSYIKRPNSSGWTTINQAELQAELAAYNIHTQVVDRYIVTQSRQAVDVADAIKLVKHLEILTGTGSYEVQIEELGNQIQQLAEKLDQTQQHISSLESERDALAPHVAHWHKVQHMEAEFVTAKVTLLQDQQQHGHKLIGYQQQQVQQVQEAASAATEQLQTLTQQEQQLAQQEGSLTQQLSNCKRNKLGLKKKIERLSASAASSKVQLTSATAALKNQQAVAEKLQAKIDNLLAAESEHKHHIARLQQQAGQLQQRRDEAQQRLAAEQVAAVAADTSQTANSNTSGHLSTGNKPNAELIKLQDDLVALEAEAIQLQAARAAAAANAERAAAHVAAVQKKLDSITDMTEQTQVDVSAARQEVEASGAAVAAAKMSAETAEQQWREAHWQQCGLQEQLRHHQQHLQHNTMQQHQQQHSSRQHYTAPGSWPAYDTAVQQLQQQLPPGSFLGRLTNCMFIKTPSAAAAVNMAMQEICDLNRTLIVRDRQTAAAVINHFKQQRIGTVHCRILAECRSSRHNVQGYNSNSSSGTAVAHTGSSEPLLQHITAAAGMPDEFHHLLDHLLGSWLLVADRQEANRLLHLRKNLVTGSGEVFKADGEIVVNMNRHMTTAGGGSSKNSRHHSSNSNPYALQCGSPTPIAGAAQSTGTAVAQDGEGASDINNRTAAAARAAEKEVQQLQQQVATAQQQAAAAADKLRSARTKLLYQQQQLAAAERAVQQIQQRQQAESLNAAATLPELQQQLAAAQQQQLAADKDVDAAAAAVDQAQQQQQELLSQINALVGDNKTRARKGASVDTGSSSGSTTEKSTAMLFLSRAAEELAAAEAAVADVWQQIDQVQQQQKRAVNRAAALKKELQKVMKAAADGQELFKLQDELSSTEQQLTAAQQELQTTQSDKQHLSSKLKSVRQQLTKANRAAADAGKQHQEYKAELQQQQDYLNRLQQEQQQRHELLIKLQPQQQSRSGAQDSKDVMMQDAAAAAAAADSEVMDDDRSGADSAVLGTAQHGRSRSRRSTRQKHMRRTRRKAAAIRDGTTGSSSSSSSNDGSDASSGEDPDSPNRCQKAATHDQQSKQRQQRQQQKGEQISAAALTKEGQRLQVREQQLSHQERNLQQQRIKINESALDRDLTALEQLESALGHLQQFEQQHDAAAAKRDKLLDERYQKLLSVLQQLNLRLDDVYKQLTGGAGSAYCAYTQDRRLLFSQGVTVHIQPDGCTWRRFSMLSGGQQALATLALSFALQALFPSPFYFFDEVDCALDTIAAGRVAAYVKSMCAEATSPHSSAAGSAAAAAGKTPVGVGGQVRSSSVSTPSAAAQYLLVSHRPVVFESAGCLVGVYSNGRGSSAAVVAQF